MIYDFEESKGLIYCKGIFLCSNKASTTTHSLNTSWPSIYKTFWNKKNHRTYFKRFLVATKVEVCERIHHTCNMCGRAKAPRHHLYGLLQPLPIFKSPWPFISMDFIIDLPCSKSFDSILVLVDLFTKMMYFIQSLRLWQVSIFWNFSSIYKYHGLPLDIVSDHGSQFISAFCKRLFKLLGVQIKLS
jgi:hypothetical protein